MFDPEQAMSEIPLLPVHELGNDFETDFTAEPLNFLSSEAIESSYFPPDYSSSTQYFAFPASAELEVPQLPVTSWTDLAPHQKQSYLQPFLSAPSLVSPASPGSSTSTSPSSPSSSPSSAPSSSSTNPSTGPKKKRDRVCDIPDEQLNPESLAKRMRRRELNKISAQNSRQRKNDRMKELEDELGRLGNQNSSLQAVVQDFATENQILRDMLLKAGIQPPPPAMSYLRMASMVALVCCATIMFALTFTDAPATVVPTHSRSLLTIPNSALLTQSNIEQSPLTNSRKNLDDGVTPFDVATALQLVFPDHPFDHRYTELNLVEAFKYLKTQGQPETQYLVCPSMHSITLHSPNRAESASTELFPHTNLENPHMKTTRIPPALLKLRGNISHEVEEEEVVIDSHPIAIEPVSVMAPPQSVITPPLPSTQAVEADVVMSNVSRSDKAPAVVLLLPPGGLISHPDAPELVVNTQVDMDFVTCSSELDVVRHRAEFELPSQLLSV
eukprot:c7396_g1_i1.p1 GENE.c7396_g1_i1~~c7396_g1_i1.p1  ORF type:complete len:499 (-),score=92.16 c7396_g1_i1:76-1572(-)